MRNRVLDEAALEAERWASGRPGYVVTGEMRGLLNDFAEHLRGQRWFHPNAESGPLAAPKDASASRAVVFG
jgi:hypothetical protein